MSAPGFNCAAYAVISPAGREDVTASRGSAAAMASSNSAASRTVRAIGPAVSCEAEIGMIPVRLTSPTVGFTPTSPHTDAGDTIEPSVSVPMPTTHRLAATAAAVPELEPEVLRSRA